MKNTRIERLKQSKRVKQATKLLTVGLLVCPLAIGTIRALADEAETTPPAEQVEETPSTTEEVETIESVQPEVVEKTQPAIEQPSESVEQSSETQVLEDIEKEESETFAIKASYSENFYTSSENPMWGGDSCMYTYTFSNGSVISFHFDSPDFNNFTWLMNDYVNDEYVSIEGTATSGQAISFDFNGNHYETSLTVDVIPTKKNCTVTFATRGNGTISNSPTLQVEEGTIINISDYTSATASEGWYFKGWEARGYMGLSGVGISDDTVITAVFEQGSLNWEDYDNQLSMYESYMELKDIYEYFGYMEEYENLVSLYDGQVDFKTENLNSTTMSQEFLDSISKGVTGAVLNFMDRVFFFQDNILSQIEDYHTSLTNIYDDKTSYTTESKQSFDEAYQALKELIDDVNGGTWGEKERKYFDAYQALKAAESGLVAAETGESFTVGELDRVKAKEVLAQYNSLVESDYTPESWAKMKEILNPKDSVGIVASLEMLCSYPNDHILTGSNKESVQQGIYDWTNTITEAMKVLVKVGSEETPLQQSIAKLKRTITSAESKLTESNYTAQSTKALQEALQNAKDVLASASSTQAEIDEAQKALDLAIANLVKEDNSNGGNTGNSGSNGTGSSSNNPNTSNNGTNNTDNQTNNKQNSTTTTTKPAGNNTSKDGLPQTGEQSATNAVIAGLSITTLSILAWFKRKKV